MPNINTTSRRDFVSRMLTAGAGLGLGSLLNIPPFTHQAMAEGSIGANGKKLIFLFLRGGNDGLNTVVPVGDPEYGPNIRSSTLIPSDAGTNYSETNIPCDFPVSGDNPTFAYQNSIRVGNGFAGLHPSLKFLAPVYNSGDLLMLHRVGYPQQSRSHFDSQIYWESGVPNDRSVNDGIFYRTMIESGLAGTAPLTGVSFQQKLPVLLQGPDAAMTNLSDPLRYNLLGVPNDSGTGILKARNEIDAAQNYQWANKNYRNLLDLQYGNLSNTLDIFGGIDFTETGNTFVDDENTDDGNDPYFLFPSDKDKNGGYTFNNNDGNKFVVDNTSQSRSFFKNLKAAALMLNHTDAIVAGTEFTKFDSHANQGGVDGIHSDLLQRVGWAIYSLRKYFKIYGKNGTNPSAGAKVSWDDVVVVTLTEFGRTTVENTSSGTDHAEAGVMFVAGGGVKGYGKSGLTTGVIGADPQDTFPWVTGPTGSMFAVRDRYLERVMDFRSVLGKLIRNHLGATQDQLNRIIPGYTNEAGEHLLSGGLVTEPVEAQGISTNIIGEPDLLV